MNKNEIILYETSDHAVRLNVNTDGDTVWLNRAQLSELFDRDIKTIGKHINNALKEELSEDNSVVAKFATTAADGNKRIAAAMFLYFLDKNGALFLDEEKNEKAIADHTLAALTIMIAESQPAEKDMMITVIMNCIIR